MAEIKKLCGQPKQYMKIVSFQNQITSVIWLINRIRSKKTSAPNNKKQTRCIIFCSCRKVLRTLFTVIKQMKLKPLYIDRKATPFLRSTVIRKFKADPSSILVTTDCSARNPDIPRVPFVLNFHPPDNDLQYFQRMSKTTKNGSVLTLLRKRDQKRKDYFMKKLCSLPSLKIDEEQVNKLYKKVSPHEKAAKEYLKNKSKRTRS